MADQDEVVRRLLRLELDQLHRRVWVHGIMSPLSSWTKIIQSDELADLLNSHGWTLAEYIHACKFYPCDHTLKHMASIFAEYE